MNHAFRTELNKRTIIVLTSNYAATTCQYYAIYRQQDLDYCVKKSFD